MKKKQVIKNNIKPWSTIKDSIYGKRGTARRDALERDAETFTLGLMIRQAREKKKITQEQLASKLSKQRTYISRVENDGSNITLKTLYEIVELGLGGKVNITIKW
jgi:ribosome-binding protein aMBF1 (putative translation factor)